MIEIILLGISMILLRVGLKDLKIRKGMKIRTILGQVMSLYFVTGLLLSIIGGYMFGKSLGDVPLIKAFPRLSLVYAVMIPLEVMFLKEPLTKNEIIGVFLIIGGSMLL